MQGRERVRLHLGGRDADRPPLIAFATDFAARLEQVEARELWQDVGVLTRTLMSLEGLFGLDAIVVDVPVAALADGRLATVADGVARLRMLLDDRAALVLALPGPLTCAADAGRDRTPETLEDLGAEILDAAKTIGPEHADCLAVIERAPVTGADVQPLDDALTPLWNAARYYAAPSLLVAADGPGELADSGADALVVWAGASPHELAARGARRVGAPIEPPSAGIEAAELPELPAGGFYSTRGELPADTEIEWLHHVVAATEQGR
jgi:hypothetical protein